MCSNKPENRAESLKNTGGVEGSFTLSPGCGKGKTQSRWSRRAGGSLGAEGKLETMGCKRTWRRGLTRREAAFMSLRVSTNGFSFRPMGPE